MTHVPVTASRLPRTWLPAVLISVVVSVLCAAALYYILAQHDRALVKQRNAAAMAAAEQRARATAQTLARFSESLVPDQLAAVQQVLEGALRQSDLLDAAVMTENDVVLAASNPDSIGKRPQDPAWTTARRKAGGSATLGMEKGTPALIIAEPFRQAGRASGWIRLAVATPSDAAALRSEKDLGRDVAIAVGPLLLLMATLLILTLRGIMSQVRSMLVGILLEADGPPQNRPGIVADAAQRG